MNTRARNRKLTRSLHPVIESLEQRLQVTITLIDATQNIHQLEKPNNTINFG